MAAHGLINRLIASVVAAAFVLAVAAGATAGQAATPTLVGATGPNSGVTMTLKLNGKKVVKIKAGKYKVVVKDTATEHNFRLKGPGVNKFTSVAGTGTVTWTVVLKKGKYAYLCDPHLPFMRWTFVVV